MKYATCSVLEHSSSASAVQMVSGAAVSVNLNDALEHLEKASRQGVQLAVLPENFACFDSGSALAELACREQQYAEIRGRLAEQAKRLGMWIVAGTLPLPAADGRCYASSLVFNSYLVATSLLRGRPYRT